MEIRKAAYELCKGMPALPGVSEIAQLVLSFNNTELGYFAHQQFQQALGYLLINQEREALAGKPFPHKIEPLEDRPLKLLAGLHKQFTTMNEQCIKRLTESLPNCTPQALSPYNRFSYNPIDEVIEIDILPAEAAKKLIDAFQLHPQIQVAIESSSVVPPTFSPEHYMQHGWQLEDAIKASGALRIPEFLDRINFREHKTSHRRTFLRHISAIVGIRASLSVLNQLIFQKIFHSKLLVLDESNTIKFGSFHLATGGASIIYQHAGLLYIMEINDIILLKTILLGQEVTKLCRVELLDPGIPLLDFGEPRYAELREIDEHLDPYGRLFRGL